MDSRLTIRRRSACEPLSGWKIFSSGSEASSERRMQEGMNYFNLPRESLPGGQQGTAARSGKPYRKSGCPMLTREETAKDGATFGSARAMPCGDAQSARTSAECFLSGTLVGDGPCKGHVGDHQRRHRVGETPCGGVHGEHGEPGQGVTGIAEQGAAVGVDFTVCAHQSGEGRPGKGGQGAGSGVELETFDGSQRAAAGRDLSRVDELAVGMNAEIKGRAGSGERRAGNRSGRTGGLINRENVNGPVGGDGEVVGDLGHAEQEITAGIGMQLRDSEAERSKFGKSPGVLVNGEHVDRGKGGRLTDVQETSLTIDGEAVRRNQVRAGEGGSRSQGQRSIGSNLKDGDRALGFAADEQEAAFGIDGNGLGRASGEHVGAAGNGGQGAGGVVNGERLHAVGVAEGNVHKLALELRHVIRGGAGRSGRSDSCDAGEASVGAEARSLNAALVKIEDEGRGRSAADGARAANRPAGIDGATVRATALGEAGSGAMVLSAAREEERGSEGQEHEKRPRR